MAKSASESKIRDLLRQLEEEKVAHAASRNQLQAEIATVWRMVPSYYINLMGVFPPLRRLLHVLGEAADLQDPTSGAPMSDTMRTEVTELTATERAVLTHQRHRANVATMNTELEWVTHKLSKLIPGEESQYRPPDGKCSECGRYIFQTGTGRPREHCSKSCRQKAARRNATKAESAVGS